MARPVGPSQSDSALPGAMGTPPREGSYARYSRPDTDQGYGAKELLMIESDGGWHQPAKERSPPPTTASH